MWDDLLNRANASVWRMPDGSVASQVDPMPKGVLPGSFNPLHQGHRDLRAAAEAWLEGPVYYELSVANVDKPSLKADAIAARLSQFVEHPVWITAAPTFEQKAIRLPNVVFIVGADTALRIVDPRYYEGSELNRNAALETIRETGCRFLVAGRSFEGRYLTAKEIPVPIGSEDLFEPLPESHFRRDVSSTALRAEGES